MLTKSELSFLLSDWIIFDLEWDANLDEPQGENLRNSEPIAFQAEEKSQAINKEFPLVINHSKGGSKQRPDNTK